MGDVISLTGVEYARLHDYLGPWAMHGPALAGLRSAVAGMDLAAHVVAGRAGRGEPTGTNGTDGTDEPRVTVGLAGSVEWRTEPAMAGVQVDGQGLPPVAVSTWKPGRSGVSYGYAVVDGVAVLEMRGVLMKMETSLGEGTSTVMLRRSVRNAVADPEVGSLVLVVDSPGGTVAGTRELAQEVARAKGVKPVVAYVEDLGASAAYWVASQASEVVAGPTALVGSIGTLAVVVDSSEMAAKDGVRVVVVSTGPFKGAGTPGTAFTAEMEADLQGIVDGLNGFFLEGVAEGRELSAEQVLEAADGRVYVAGAAKRRGLVDAVGDFGLALEQARKLSGSEAKGAGGRGGRSGGARGMVMSVDESEETEVSEMASNLGVAATPAEIREACAGADAGFVLEQLENGASVEQAVRAWNGVLAGRLAEAGARVSELETALAAAEARAVEAEARVRPGGPSVRTAAPASGGGGGEGGSLAELVAAEQAKRPGMDRHEATRRVLSRNPGLREELVAAANS